MSIPLGFVVLVLNDGTSECKYDNVLLMSVEHFWNGYTIMVVDG